MTRKQKNAPQGVRYLPSYREAQLRSQLCKNARAAVDAQRNLEKLLVGTWVRITDPGWIGQKNPKLSYEGYIYKIAYVNPPNRIGDVHVGLEGLQATPGLHQLEFVTVEENKKT